MRPENTDPVEKRKFLPPISHALLDEPQPGAKLEAGYIRYVCILPKSSDEEPADSIICRTCIRRSKLPDITIGDHLLSSDTAPYLAISYAWGDPTPRRLILVDGQERMIAENLWQFLKHAKRRPEQLSCWLWIDALCIDQSDAEERRHQVGIMSQIFKNASQVVVWLGNADDDSDLAIRALSTSEGNFGLLGSFISGELGDVPENYREYNKAADALCMSASRAISRLCQRPYWKRLWVFQELRHAGEIDIMCGEQAISWTKFSNLWSVVAEFKGLNAYITWNLRNSLATRMVTLRAKPIDFSLWNLLRETKDLLCADQRDRVYALLSVATRGREGIEANYHQPVAELCHRVLCNKYDMRPPVSIEDLERDCKFLDQIVTFGEVGDTAQPFLFGGFQFWRGESSQPIFESNYPSTWYEPFFRTVSKRAPPKVQKKDSYREPSWLQEFRTIFDVSSG